LQNEFNSVARHQNHQPCNLSAHTTTTTNKHTDASHLVPQMYLQDLAEADAPRELVQGVQEFYADFVALGAHHFTVPVASANDILLNPRAAGAPGAPSECVFLSLDVLLPALQQIEVANYFSVGDDATHHARAHTHKNHNHHQQPKVRGARPAGAGAVGAVFGAAAAARDPVPAQQRARAPAGREPVRAHVQAAGRGL
jgi:hypothetical protein